MNNIQDETEALIKRHEQLVSERGPREALWRDCEKWVDPNQQGGFYRRVAGGQRDAHITDDTARVGLETFVSAMNAMLTPEGEQVTRVTTSDPVLNDVPAVQQWLQKVSDRLHDCRNAVHTGFGAQNSLRWRMLGIYGWAGFWVDEDPGRGLFYKTIHPSEIFIDDNFRGHIDTIHRQIPMKARQLVQMFHNDNLPPKVLEDVLKVPDREYTLIHILRPNSAWEPGRLDAERFPIQSIYLLKEGKHLIQVKGYYTMPLAVSRYALSPYDAYGVGPAGSCIGSIRMLNQMNRDLMKATHLGMQPPILMPSDGTITKLEMTPGAPIPGGMENGHRMMEPFHVGGDVAYTKETFENARRYVDASFLVQVFAIMNAPIDRQTATEFLGRKREAMMLQAPNAGRQISEAMMPQVAREVDILLRAGQLPPAPPEVREAGASLKYEFDNPLTRAAKSADAQNFLGALQMLEPMSQIDPSIMDVIDTDAAPRGVMTAMGVRADWLANPDAVAAKRQQRAGQQQAEQLAQAGPAATQAMLNMAKARALPAGAV